MGSESRIIPALESDMRLSMLVHEAVDNMKRPRQTGAAQPGNIGGGK